MIKKETVDKKIDITNKALKAEGLPYQISYEDKIIKIFKGDSNDPWYQIVTVDHRAAFIYVAGINTAIGMLEIGE